jgi:hypothetical protein
MQVRIWQAPGAGHHLLVELLSRAQAACVRRLCQLMHGQLWDRPKASAFAQLLAPVRGS